MRGLAVFVLLAAMNLAGCGVRGPGVDEGQLERMERAPARKDITEFSLSPYRGKVVLLLLGCVGCEVTAEAYHHMQELSGRYGREVAFLRVDFGQGVAETNPWYEKNPPRFEVFGDPTGAVGNALPSQAMPTLYLWGKWGQMRFSGGMDPKGMDDMISKLLAETRPDPAHFFRKIGLGRGDAIPEFALVSFEGSEVGISEYRKGANTFLLAFAGTECPYSKEGTKGLASFLDEYGSRGLKILIVNTGQEPDDIRDFYESLERPLPVLIDADGTLAKACGVEVLPTLFLAGPDGTIAFTSQWNREALEQEIQILLGLRKPEERRPVKNSGLG